MIWQLLIYVERRIASDAGSQMLPNMFSDSVGKKYDININAGGAIYATMVS